MMSLSNYFQLRVYFHDIYREQIKVIKLTLEYGHPHLQPCT